MKPVIEKNKCVNLSVSIVLFNATKEDFFNITNNIAFFEKIDHVICQYYLIDNNSSDINSKKMLKNLKIEANVTKIFLKENYGFGGGHNSILQQIDSEIHIIMNADVILNDRDGIVNSLKFMKSHDNVALLSPLIKGMDEEIQYLNRKEPTVFDLAIRFLGPNVFSTRQASFVKKDQGYKTIQNIENASGCFMMIRTAALQQVGGFDDRYFMYMEDTDLTKKIAKIGTCLFFPDLVITHKWVRGNHSLKGSLQMIRSMISYFNKWGWKLY